MGLNELFVGILVRGLDGNDLCGDMREILWEDSV